MKSIIENKLSKFMFPVTERKVYVEDFLKGKLNKTAEYKAIFREDKNRLIAITKSTYKLVPNSEVIMPLIEELDKLTTRWIIDPSHTFVSDARMRIQISFPEITISDGRSDIALSLFLHNSYNQTEGIRAYFGGIRGICSNGMVFGEVLSKFYHRHTEGFRLKNLKEEIEKAYDRLPEIKRRIEILKNLEVTDPLRQSIEEKLGKGISKYVAEQYPSARTQWVLYNLLTYYISHIVKQHMRAHDQLQVSKLFKL
jgi:hypothetical protein